MSVCTIILLLVHMNMGESWSPQLEVKVRHKLITHGIFRFARQPMYAVLLWAALGTLHATFNCLVTWCVFGSVFFTFQRINNEDRILEELFGDAFREYQCRISALGPPWQCLKF